MKHETHDINPCCIHAQQSEVMIFIDYSHE